MGESRESFESRNYKSTPKKRSSESRGNESRSYRSPSRSSESRGDESRSYSAPSRSSESRGEESRDYARPQKPQYNNIADIDKLIKRLEGTQDVQSDSPAVNEALAAKKQKLMELKELVAKAKAAEAEKKLIDSIQKDSDELDRAINGLKGRNR